MHVGDRRPIVSRDRAWSKALAHWLATCGATPNGISTGGMICGILAGAALVATRLPQFQIGGFLLGAACVQLRLMANMFDGMVAIETERTSPVGELYNEVPDRVSDTATLVGAGYAVGGVPELGYAATILALWIAYIRAQGKVAGAHQEYCGPMAKQQRMAVITVAAVAAALVPSAWLPHLADYPQAGVMALALVVIMAGEVVTVVRRLARISVALRSKAREAV